MALSARDQALLNGAADGKSAEELGRLVNVPAANAVLRVQEILRDTDVWSEVERRQLLLHDLYRLKASMQTQVENGGFEAKDVGNLLKALSQIASILDSSSKITSDQLSRISSVNAAVLNDMVHYSYVRMKQQLMLDYPEADGNRLDDIFMQGLKEARQNAIGS